MPVRQVCYGIFQEYSFILRILILSLKMWELLAAKALI